MKGVSFALVRGGRKQQKIGRGLGESLAKLEPGHLVGATPETVRFINDDKVPTGGDQVFKPFAVVLSQLRRSIRGACPGV